MPTDGPDDVDIEPAVVCAACGRHGADVRPDWESLESRPRRQALLMADWSRAFDDPIPVPDGRVLRTRHVAGHYATALPKPVQVRVEWQTAARQALHADGPHLHRSDGAR